MAEDRSTRSLFPHVLGATLALLGLTAAVVLVASSAARPDWHYVDLEIYRDAPRFAAGGHSLYDYGSVVLKGQGFLYPPFAAVVFTPLQWLPDAVAEIGWIVATLLVTGASAWWVTRRGLALRSADAPAIDRPVAIGLALLITWSSFPVVNNLLCGQVSVFVVSVALADAAGLLPGRLRGLGVGLAAAVKLSPLLFVVYFAATGQRAVAARSLAAFLAATGLGFVLYPADSVRYWTREVYKTSRGGAPDGPDNHSLYGVLLRAGVQDVALIASYLLIAGSVVYLAIRWARRLTAHAEPLAASLVVSSAVALAAPLSWSHSLVGLVLAGCYVIARGGPGRMALGFAITLLLNTAWVLILDGSLTAAGGTRFNADAPAVLAGLLCSTGLAIRPLTEHR